MRILLCFYLLLLSYSSFGQREKESGQFSIGVRSTASTFSNENQKYFGWGTGGQLRLRLSEKVNTEWFADYIRSDIESVAQRTDFHIGWSVLFYPIEQHNPKQKLRFYMMAGHCF